MGPEIIAKTLEGKRKVSKRRRRSQPQSGAEVFGHAEKKPTAFLSSPEITFTKYHGFSQNVREFRGRHARCLKGRVGGKRLSQRSDMGGEPRVTAGRSEGIGVGKGGIKWVVGRWRNTTPTPVRFARKANCERGGEFWLRPGRAVRERVKTKLEKIKNVKRTKFES